ncbi:MAG TPA: hypothetical protein VMJ34_09460 [Bryobacteraceae bacterium]|nr:hypothetical protein [Bryobacteraceae bacterium]
MKTRVLFILTGLLAVSPLAAADSDTTWQFAPADAKAFIGIHWRDIQESRIGQAMRQQMAEAGFSGAPMLGILKDIDEAIIASPGRRPDDPEDKQPPVLIRVTGRFHAADIERMLAAQGAHPQLYRQKRVYRQQKDGDMAITLLDDHTLLLGDAPSIFAALTRMEWPTAPANPTAARAAKLREDYDIWAVFTMAPTEMAGRLMPNLPLIGDAQGLELGISLRSGLEFRLGLDTASGESAAKLTSELQKTLKLAVKDMHAPDVAAAAKKLQISAEKSTVRVSLRLDAAEVERSLAEAARRRAQRPAVAIALPSHPVVPPPPQRQTIHIEGLDDGPRDIPMSR